LSTAFRGLASKAFLVQFRGCVKTLYRSAKGATCNSLGQRLRIQAHNDLESAEGATSQNDQELC